MLRRALAGAQTSLGGSNAGGHLLDLPRSQSAVGSRLALVLATLCLVLLQASEAPGQALSAHEIERFLLEAELTDFRDAGLGVTGSRRATGSTDHLTHHVHIQTVDFRRPASVLTGARAQLDFRDSYRYNIGAYRLAALLGLDNVPVSVERRVQGVPAAVTWWVDDVAMDEGERLARRTFGPTPALTQRQLYTMFVFDELIQNRDRNQGNVLWTSSWKMWLIDHTRAFGRAVELTQPAVLLRIPRGLLDNLRALTADTLAGAVEGSLTSSEQSRVMRRRELLVAHFEDRIARFGEGAVVIDDAPAPGVTDARMELRLATSLAERTPRQRSAPPIVREDSADPEPVSASAAENASLWLPPVRRDAPVSEVPPPPTRTPAGTVAPDTPAATADWILADAVAAEMAGDAGTALDLYGRVLELDPGNPTAKGGRMRVLVRVADRRVDEANAAFAEGRYAEARRLLRGALDLGPSAEADAALQRIAAIEALTCSGSAECGTLVVRVTPPARAFVNDRALGIVTALDLRLAPDAYRLRLENDAWRFPRTVRIAAGERTELDVNLAEDGFPK